MVLADVQAAAAEAGMLFPLSLRLRGLLPHRRQPLHQRGRHGGARLRQCPRPRPRARGGAGRRPGLERAEGPAQGQCGLRPQAPVPRLGGHPRADHGRGAEALSPARLAGRGLRRPRLGRGRPRPVPEPAGGGRPGPDRLRVHRALRPGDRAAPPGRGPPAPGRRRTRPTPWWNSPPPGPGEDAGAPDGGVPRRGAARRASSRMPPWRRARRRRNAFWDLRESLSEVQKAEGGSIKHDVSVPLSRLPEFLAEATRACEAAMPGLRVCAFGHFGDGNIHFNLSQPVGMDRAAFLAHWERFNRIVHDIVARARRLDRGRARRRPPQARRAGALRRPGRPRPDAQPQGRPGPAATSSTRARF